MYLKNISENIAKKNKHTVDSKQKRR